MFFFQSDSSKNKVSLFSNSDFWNEKKKSNKIIYDVYLMWLSQCRDHVYNWTEWKNENNGPEQTNKREMIYSWWYKQNIIWKTANNLHFSVLAILVGWKTKKQEKKEEKSRKNKHERKLHTDYDHGNEKNKKLFIQTTEDLCCYYSAIIRYR